MVAPLLKDHGKPALAVLSDKVDVNWWRWVNDEWLIVGLGSQDTIQGEDYYVTRLIGVRADMQKMVKIDWENSGFRADEVLWTAQDGTPRILFAKQTGIYSMTDVYPSVYEADVSTGRVKRIATGQTDVWDWYADGQGQLRMGCATATRRARRASSTASPMPSRFAPSRAPTAARTNRC